MLVPRGPERTLSLAIAWFIAIPAFIVGAVAILWPVGWLFPRDCLAAECVGATISTLAPAFLFPAGAALVAVSLGSLALRRTVYVRPQLGWRLVVGLGLILILAAVAADVLAGQPHVALLTLSGR